MLNTDHTPAHTHTHPLIHTHKCTHTSTDIHRCTRNKALYSIYWHIGKYGVPFCMSVQNTYTTKRTEKLKSCCYIQLYLMWCKLSLEVSDFCILHLNTLLAQEGWQYTPGTGRVAWINYELYCLHLMDTLYELYIQMSPSHGLCYVSKCSYMNTSCTLRAAIVEAISFTLSSASFMLACIFCFSSAARSNVSIFSSLKYCKWIIHTYLAM